MAAHPYSVEGEDRLEGFVYRVPGPGGNGHRWIARSVHGHVAHGRTPESAVRSLGAGLRGLAQAAGQPFMQWYQAQSTDGARFLRAGELVQA